MSDRAGSMRVMRPLFQAEEGGSTPTSALQLFFSPTDRDTFARLNRDWHSRLPKINATVGGKVFYSAEFDGIAYAVAMWSNPVARLLPQKTWLELRRFAIADDSPPNTASRMLAWMARDIRQRFPEIVRLVSYQDTEVHDGTIYKASGWKQAEGYKGRRKGWAAGQGGGATRMRRTNQAPAIRMRWEKAL